MIDRKAFHSSWKKFDQDFRAKMREVVKEINVEGKEQLPNIIESRDRSASGDWGKENPTTVTKITPYFYIVGIASYERGLYPMNDARNVGSKPHLIPYEVIKNWCAIRGITDEKAVNAIRFSIAKRGTSSSAEKMSGGIRTTMYDNTIYEELRDRIFDMNKINDSFNNFIGSWNG